MSEEQLARVLVMRVNGYSLYASVNIGWLLTRPDGKTAANHPDLRKMLVQIKEEVAAKQPPKAGTE